MFFSSKILKSLRNKQIFHRVVLPKGSYHHDSWNILYFGTDEFAVVLLDSLNSKTVNSSNLIQNIEVVCPPEKRREKDIKKATQISTVREYAEFHNLPIHTWPLEKEKIDLLSKFHLGIVVSFGYFLPAWIIKRFSRGAINVHPSLLPRWRGPSPIVHTLLHGDRETGISIIEVSPKKFDAGKILLQKKIEICRTSTYNELSQDLSALASSTLIEVLRSFSELQVSAKEQDETAVTKAPKVSREMSYLRWNEFTCQDIERRYRAIGNRFGLQCKWRDHVVKLEKFADSSISLSDGVRGGKPFYDMKRNILYIKCKDGWVGWLSLKFQYKKSITAMEFYNGYLIVKETGEMTSCCFEDM